jgi:hypothetical protein
MASSIPLAAHRAELRAPSTLRSENLFNRLHERCVWILKAVFFDFVCVPGELLSVYGQVPTLAMKIAIQPDRDAIWIRDFVGGELAAIDLRHVY